jgi:2',3'-cyclic-nucleotide 2'-phosphodiesterase (5'-nucleotidase family)
MMNQLQILLIFSFVFISCSKCYAQDITVIYTNNNNGNIVECECEDLPYGGLARKKTIFDRLRSERYNNVIVDAGDFLDQFGTRMSQDELVVKLYEKLGYDAVNIGDNELANEKLFFDSKLLASKIPLVSSTLTNQKNEKVAKSYIIKNFNDLSIALIGYTPLNSFQYFPAWKKLAVQIENERDQLKKALAEVSGKADMIILLSNSGDDEDYNLAKSFPEIDIIVGGHSQVELEEPVQIGKTIIVQAGGNGAYVGQLDITFSKKNKKAKVVANKLIPLDNSVKEHPETKKVIDEFLSNSKSK